MSTRQSRRPLLRAHLLALTLTFAPLARAEEPSPAPPPNDGELLPEPASGAPAVAAASARELGNRGLVAYSAGDFGAALEHFGRAEELAHSPVFRLYIARSLHALGRTEEARAVYQSILEEVPAGEAESSGSGGQTSESTPSRAVPVPWLRARGEASRELEALSPTTPAPGTPKPPASEIPKSEQKPALASTSASRVASPREGLGPERWAAVSAFAIGGAGLVTAVVTGSLALSLASEVRSNCVDSVCPAEDQPKADRATTLGNVATASIVVAAVGTAAGVTLLSLAPPRKRQPTVALEARGPSLVVHGRF